MACASSFVILFCGFLFFSDLLTSCDSAIVLWFTVSLVVFTYLVIFFFVFFDLFPYGVKVVENFRFWLQARRSRGGKTAEEAEASYRAMQRWKRARAAVLRRVRGNARLLFRKEFAIKLTKASGGDPLILLIYYGLMTVVFSAVLNNVTAMIIIGSLSAVSLERLGRGGG